MHQELNASKGEKINFEQRTGPENEMEEKLKVKKPFKTRLQSKNFIKLLRKSETNCGKNTQQIHDRT
jgi:hypothetical protein